MALKALGYRNEHPVVRKGLEATRELIWEMGDRALYMPCVSPNWDTALAAKALLDSGMSGDHPALKQSAGWLIEHQIFKKGDWSVKRPDLEPGGWAFEFYNDTYPDVDDSAVILEVLARTEVDNDRSRRSARFARAPTGRWACNRATADSPLSMLTVRRSGSIRFRSPMSRPSSIRRVPI